MKDFKKFQERLNSTERPTIRIPTFEELETEVVPEKTNTKPPKKIGVPITESAAYEVLYFNGESRKLCFEAGTDFDDVKEAIGEAIAILPNEISNDFLNSISEEHMTSDEEKERERIIIGLKKNSAKLKEKYGDRWEAVMYAIATKHAMNESYIAESAEKEIAKKKAFSGGTLTLNTSNDNYIFRRKDESGEIVDEQIFNNYKDAENTFNTQI